MNEAISDPLDVASNNEHVNCEMKVREIQAIANEPLPTSKKCLWCNEKTKKGRRWCNADHRDWWERFGGQ